MREKLSQIKAGYVQLTARMEQPEVYGDPAAYAALAREQKELAPLMAAYDRLCSLDEDLEAAKALGLSPAEQAEIRAEQTAAEEQLRRLLLPRDPDDSRSAVMEIRAGTGGEEAALFARDLYRMYALYAQKRGWTLEIADLHETELGGIKEISLTVEGEAVWARLKYEVGIHCVKRIPATEANGRIQTSTATVAVLPEAREADVAIDPADLRIDTFRSSGAGGQKVNKTSSAIRITHLPTGLVVECQDERSQYRNKDKAMTILRSKLYEAERQRLQSQEAAQRRSQVGTGGRSDKIRTYFFLRGQMTEQRLTGETRSFNLEDILNGNLDKLIDALTWEDETERLKATEHEN